MNKKSEFFEGAKGTLQSNKAVFKRGKEQAVVARLTLNGRTIVAPIHVLPGMANYTIVLPPAWVAQRSDVLAAVLVSMLTKSASRILPQSLSVLLSAYRGEL